MPMLAGEYPRTIETRYLGPARVLEVDETGDWVRLGFPESGEDRGVWARVALPGSHELRSGDTALAIGEDPGDLYVIGLLSRKEGASVSSRRVESTGGAYAEAAGPAGDQTLRVFSPQHELLFEYDGERGQARVNLEAGDLEFVTQKGKIAFRAGGDLHSALTLQPHQMKLISPEVSVYAERGDFQVEETAYRGRSLAANVGCLKLIAERLETVAQSVIEKAKNLYQTIEQLSQLKAGRVRTLVTSTFHFKTRKAFLKAEEDYKIKAERIHLG